MMQFTNTKKYQSVDYDRNPMEDASIFSILTFSWINTLIKRGAEKALEAEDIYPLPSYNRATNIYNIADGEWKKEIEQSKKQGRPPHFKRALFNAFASTLLFSVFSMMPYIAASVLQPLFVAHFIEYVTQNHTRFLSISNPYGLVFLLSGISTISVVFFNNCIFHTTRVGIWSRSAVMTMIYTKALKLSSASRSKHTTGEMVNLMTVDSERVWTGVQYWNWLWAGPVLVIISMVLIIRELGVSAFVALGAMLFINYVQATVSKSIGGVRQKLVKITDERVKVINEVLQGIRIIKLYAWEQPIQERIEALRLKEIETLKSYQLRKSFNVTFTLIGPVLVTFVLFITFVSLGGQLTVARVYTVYSLLNLLRLPFSLTPQAYSAFIEALVSLDRITKFLLLEEVDDVPLITSDTSQKQLLVSIKNANFSWETKENKENVVPTLKDVNLDIYEGEFIAVVGSVGSGKSSLLAAILGEMVRDGGSQLTTRPIAYVGQEHWIRNQTLLDNAIFNSNFDDDKYVEVVDASQLSNDLLSLPKGDHTFIGERGINLSGGQKARVNIARSLYKTNEDVKLYLFDDALAAVDVHVGKALFQEALCGTLKSFARVVVLSSNYHFLPSFDKIVVVLDGEMKMIGTYDEVTKEFPNFKHSAHSNLNNNNETGQSEPLSVIAEAKPVLSSFNSQRKKIESKRELNGGGLLMIEEDREKGAVALSTYLNYFASTSKSGSPLMAYFLILVFIATQAGRTMSDIWLGTWAANTEPDNDGVQHYSHTDTFYRTGYILITCLASLLAMWRGYQFILLCLQASRNLHSRILRVILSASIPNYFDVTPVGRILNRFSRDLDSVDSLLPDFFFQSAQNTMQVLFIFIVCMTSSPYFVLLMIPIGLVFYYFQRYFRQSSREIKRLDSISRSPLYSHFGETLNGLQTIRAYTQQNVFIDKFFVLVDSNNRNFFSFWMASRWLALRLDFIGVVVIFCVCILAVSLSDQGNTINPNFLGLALTYSFQLTGLLQWTVRVGIEAESNMTSVERLLVFSHIESELGVVNPDFPTQDKGIELHKQMKTDSHSWPNKGQITIENLQLRYRPGLDLVLRGVNMTIPGGAKWGIVGRTGAGKSSLMLALFRIVEPEEGSQIFIDGEDILSLDLHKLRSNLTIIPQDPVMFSGTLRYNLDPFNSHTDEEIWTALELSHLKDDVISKFPLRLEHIVSEKGENISVGQKQLVCIARALLRKPKILVLDEATASVDSITDAKIQDSVRKHFKNCTVLTIAHRLETIADYDTVVVMDQGRVAEFGDPLNLLNLKDGLFRGLVDELGNERKDHFIEMAKKNSRASELFSTAPVML